VGGGGNVDGELGRVVVDVAGAAVVVVVSSPVVGAKAGGEQAARPITRATPRRLIPQPYVVPRLLEVNADPALTGRKPQA
jgi:hypothetical protein